ncbi:MAG: GNAT family N-acetyltransferase [Dehalococcoidia bacterium]|nr:GNAT family N-acetyltransferase [Dehalococcoidia bacterium]
MDNSEIRVEHASHNAIVEAWRERWGGELIVSPRRDYRPEDVEGLVATGGNGEVLGLVTWHLEAEEAEVVSLDALVPGKGYGRALLRSAVNRLREMGAHRVVLFTTNDNVDAIRMYLLEGWRVVGIHLDAMDAVRARKPGSAQHRACTGCRLQDMWELER